MPLLANDSDDENPRHELSVSYGMAPAYNVINDFGTLLGAIMISPITGGKVNYTDSKCIGVINVDYNYHLLPWLAVGANASYSSSSRDALVNDKKVGDEKGHQFTVMANLKMDWLRRKHVTLYSRISAGSSFASEKYTDESTTSDESETCFMGQISPFGIEVGSPKLRVFSEIGFGQAGAFQLGLRTRF